MTPVRLLAVAALIMPAACGRVADLRPASGRSLPVKPLMARATPTPNELLSIPTYAKPGRVDELMKRSEPRAQDPFDLPPATGGNAPSLPPGSQTRGASSPDQQSEDSPGPSASIPPGD